MKCKECGYRFNVKNTEECGKAICSYPNSYFMTDMEDDCHFITEPGSKRLTCGDCSHFYDDPACWGCDSEEEIYHKDRDGKECPCGGFCDKREDQFWEILSFWRETGLHSKEDIFQMIENFEIQQEKIKEEIEGKSK